ncbi:MAG TPA: hypothetical protein VM491_19505 [Burkholderiaceae bacterium]|jgi:hypothetical protein|nr:hypothetical protein [Burkholderiaceae bacterium]
MHEIEDDVTDEVVETDGAGLDALVNPDPALQAARRLDATFRGTRYTGWGDKAPVRVRKPRFHAYELNETVTLR